MQTFGHNVVSVTIICYKYSSHKEPIAIIGSVKQVGSENISGPVVVGYVTFIKEHRFRSASTSVFFIYLIFLNCL